MHDRLETVDRDPLVWASVLPAAHDRQSVLRRATWLTPYAAETIVEDALRAGRGARLELTVPASATDSALARVRERFAHLGNRGVLVSVRRTGPDADPA
jgi:hypothetical protein